MSREAKRYWKDVRLFFKVYGKEEKRFMKDLREQIAVYEREHTECSYDALSEEFGEPLEVVAGYMLQVDDGFLCRKLNLHNIWKKILIVLLVLSFMFSAGYVFWGYKGVVDGRKVNTGREYIYYNSVLKEIRDSEE